MDFGMTSGDYARYRAGFPAAFFDRLQALGICNTGDRVLDLGTGTGTVARNLALRGCRVVALDPSGPMLEEARRLDRQAGADVDYRQATAEDTELRADSFDTVVAGQCWHWFDREAAAREAMRVLRPGGTLVIAHFDWLPLPSNVVEATERLIRAHNPSWTMGGGTGIYPLWLTDAAMAGFGEIETFSFDVSVPYTHEAWRGRVRASAGVAASLNEEQVHAFDKELQNLLRTRFSRDSLEVPHRVFAVLARNT